MNITIARARDASATEAPRTSGAGRAYLGLALLGWGLAILIGVTPHEDLVVGVGLGVFGLALFATSPRLPELRPVPAWVVATAGLFLVGAVVGYELVVGTGFGGPKAALVVLGAVLVAAAPFLERRIPFGRGGRSLPLSSIAVWCATVLGAPLAVWALQAVTTGIVGTTPTEAFVSFGLIVPLAWFLWGLGLRSDVDGQLVTYATREGPLTLEVGAACSGIQAMALFGGVLALFLWTERPRSRRLALWCTLGIVGVYLANLLRLAFLTLVGYQWGPDTLLRAHAQVGWVFFVGWALLFSWMARRRGRPV